jgi:CRISPR-associated protein Csd1
LSWFANLAETYDRLGEIVGKPDSDGNTLLPANHMTAKTDICVTIDGEGSFRRAAGASDDAQTIVIPCTEDSSIRTNGVNPHPLHEQLGYLALDREKHEQYIGQLAKWKDCHPKVLAVYRYIMKGTLLDDLRKSGIIVDVAAYDEDGKLQSEKKIKEAQGKINKLFIRFSVEIQNDLVPDLWLDETVANEWITYCNKTNSSDKALCYVTGNEMAVTGKHPKGINASANGAKLISCNDDTNYTYRGRFTKSNQANAISTEASHKAHAALKYLIATQGYKCDTQAIVAWAIDGGTRQPAPFKDSFSLSVDYEDKNKTDNEKLIEARGVIETNYAKKLRSALMGFGGIPNPPTKRHVAVISTDAATTGRMGVTFYQDMLENEYVERIVLWHESCCWHFIRRVGERVINCITAPSADRIIAAVFGEPTGEGYNKIKKQARERLLHNILCGEAIDRAWVNAAVQRVSSPFSYDKKEGGWNKFKWEEAISVTCAIARKSYMDRKEKFDLELEKTRTDRDYLFGRLLAVADKLESHARYLQTGKNDTDKRPTNAVRYMPRFAMKPYSTWGLLCSQLNPYMQRLDGATWYQTQIDEIKSLFLSMDEYASDKPLSAKYLMGYSLQRIAMNQKNKKEESKNEPEQKN